MKINTLLCSTLVSIVALSGAHAGKRKRVDHNYNVEYLPPKKRKIFYETCAASSPNSKSNYRENLLKSKNQLKKNEIECKNEYKLLERFEIHYKNLDKINFKNIFKKLIIEVSPENNFVYTQFASGDLLRKFPNLEDFELSNYRSDKSEKECNLSSNLLKFLKEININLQKLTLRNCDCFRPSFISRLSKLTELNLIDCKKKYHFGVFTSLPPSVAKLNFSGTEVILPKRFDPDTKYKFLKNVEELTIDVTADNIEVLCTIIDNKCSEKLKLLHLNVVSADRQIVELVVKNYLRKFRPGFTVKINSEDLNLEENQSLNSYHDVLPLTNNSENNSENNIEINGLNLEEDNFWPTFDETYEQEEFSPNLDSLFFVSDQAITDFDF